MLNLLRALPPIQQQTGAAAALQRTHAHSTAPPGSSHAAPAEHDAQESTSSAGHGLPGNTRQAEQPHASQQPSGSLSAMDRTCQESPPNSYHGSPLRAQHVADVDPAQSAVQHELQVRPDCSSSHRHEPGMQGQAANGHGLPASARPHAARLDSSNAAQGAQHMPGIEPQPKCDSSRPRSILTKAPGAAGQPGPIPAAPADMPALAAISMPDNSQQIEAVSKCIGGGLPLASTSQDHPSRGGSGYHKQAPYTGYRSDVVAGTISITPIPWFHHDFWNVCCGQIYCGRTDVFYRVTFQPKFTSSCIPLSHPSSTVLKHEIAICIALQTQPVRRFVSACSHC